VKPPKPQFTQTPPNPSSTLTSTFAWMDSESGVSFQCSKENGAYQACSSPLTYPVSGNGEHQFAVVALDAAGNVSEAASYKWKVNQSQQGLPFTIAGNATRLLYPGASPTPIALTITNPNSVPIYVTSLTVSVTNNPNGCTNATNVLVTQSSASSSTPITVPANTSNHPVPASLQPTVQLKETGTNQNVCQNQTFTFSYTGSAHS
jgi:hypothetical protein